MFALLATSAKKAGYKISIIDRYADVDTTSLAKSVCVYRGSNIDNFLTDTDSWYIITDVPNGMKMFQRAALKTAMEGDFDTGNVRYKARERYSFGVSDYRGIFGVEGA